jgi:ABC-type dipeptide/oligopeptide/nickel transport system permease component
VRYLRYLGVRLGQKLVAVLLVSIVLFLLVRILPSDPVAMILGERATPEMLADIRHQFGLDQPLPVQYMTWLIGILHGDFGYSLSTTGIGISRVPIGPNILMGLHITLPLAFFGTLLAAFIGMLAGLVAAARRGRLDSIISVGSLAGISIPDFYLAYLLILVFAVWLRVLPSVGYVDPFVDPVAGIRSLALPIMTIGLINSAAIAKITRASLVETSTSEYILLARSRGTPESVILLKHALRNALLPIVTLTGLQLARLFGGVVVIETMFGLPGIGRQLLLAVEQRDYPTIQGLVLVFAIGLVLTNLAVDLLYPLIDPRIRRGGR